MLSTLKNGRVIAPMLARCFTNDSGPSRGKSKPEIVSDNKLPNRPERADATNVKSPKRNLFFKLTGLGLLIGGLVIGGYWGKGYYEEIKKREIIRREEIIRTRLEADKFEREKKKEIDLKNLQTIPEEPKKVMPIPPTVTVSFPEKPEPEKIPELVEIPKPTALTIIEVPEPVVVEEPKIEKINPLSDEEKKKLASLVDNAFTELLKGISSYVRVEDIPKLVITPDNVLSDKPYTEVQKFTISTTTSKAKEAIKRKLKLSDNIFHEDMNELVFYGTLIS